MVINTYLSDGTLSYFCNLHYILRNYIKNHFFYLKKLFIKMLPKKLLRYFNQAANIFEFVKYIK